MESAATVSLKLFRWSAAIVLGLLLLGSFGNVAYAATQPTVTPVPGPTPEYSSWQQQVTNLPMPSAGCFEATFPVVEWVGGESSCGPAPSLILKVGDGNDYSAQISSGNIGESQGYVSSMSGVTSEADNASGNNYYTIQDNSNKFTCNTSDTGGINANCLEQLVFVSPGSGNGYVFIQYWLLGYISGTQTTCPTTYTGLAYPYWQKVGTNCFGSSGTGSVLASEPATSLASYQVKAYADNGGYDEAIFCNGGTCHGVSVTYAVLDLAAGWTAAEWNVLGYNNGSTACFNGSGNPCSGPSGSPSVTITQYLYNSAGTNTASSCKSTSSQGAYTVETNSLTLPNSCYTVTSVPVNDYMYFTMT